MHTSLTAAFGLCAFVLFGVGCGDAKKAEDSPREVQTSKRLAEAPTKAMEAPALKTSEIIVRRATLRALCQLSVLPGSTKAEAAVLQLSSGAAPKEVPAIFISTSLSELSSDYKTAGLYLTSLAFSAKNLANSSICQAVREAPRATMLAVLVRDTQSRSEKGYWGYSDVIGDEEMKGTGVFLGDVDESEARTKLIELVQETARGKFSSKVVTLSGIDSRWADAFNSAAE